MPGKYFIVVDGERRGPFTAEELEGRNVRRDTLVWHKGLPDWVPAAQIGELLGVFDDPPPVPGERQAAPPVAQLLPEPARNGDAGGPQDGLPIRPASVLPSGSASDAGDSPPPPRSDYIKDPAVNLTRPEPPPPSYGRDLDDLDDRPPPIGIMRIPYDVVGMRRLYKGGMFTFVPGVVLIFAVLVSIAFLGWYGFDTPMPRFDPQQRRVIEAVDRGARTAQMVASIATVAMAVLGVIGVASGATCFLVLLYRAWRVVQDGRVRPTPGRAVGLLFVPFFNAYWAFVANWGLARNLNRMVRRYDLEAPLASQSLAFTISLYSALTYFPFPFVGFVPLGLNLILLPWFMRTVYRTVVAICDDANRERIARAPFDRVLRRADLPRPVSAIILSVIAAAVTPIGVGLFIGGFGSGLDGLHRYNRDARLHDAHRAAIDQLRQADQKVMNPQDQANRIRDLENRANNLLRNSERQSEDLVLSAVLLGGGVLILGIAIALAMVSRICARSTDEPWPSAAPSRYAHDGSPA